MEGLRSQSRACGPKTVVVPTNRPKGEVEDVAEFLQAEVFSLFPFFRISVKIESKSVLKTKMSGRNR